MQETEKEQLAYAFALRCLARRGYTKRELARKLGQKGFPEEAIVSALARLDRYIKDEETLQGMIQYYIARGQGPLSIIHKLVAGKGEVRERVEMYLETLYPEEEQIAQAKILAAKKGAREKAYRFLLSRGFPHSVAMQAIQPE